MTPAEKYALQETKYHILTPDKPFPETQYGIVKRIQVIEEWLRAVKQQMGESGLTILDYGCGTGDHITAPLAHAGDEVLGIDIHEPSVREACRKYTLPSLSFRAGDFHSLLDEGLSFDVIVCSEVLEHLHNPSECLVGLRRLLRPSGFLIITTPNGYGSFEMLCHLERGLKLVGVHQLLRWILWRGRQLSRRMMGLPVPSHPLEMVPGGQDTGFLNQDSNHVQFFRLRTLERLFSDTGFHVVARRARTLLCGPYVDVAFCLSPRRQALFRMNNHLADVLPFSLAADWMFLLERKEGIQP